MWKKKATLMEEYEISESTLERIVKLIQSEMGPGKRYKEDAVIKTGSLIRVNDQAFHDAFVNRNLIELGRAPKQKAVLYG